MLNAQIVADIFHVVTQTNKELDTQRKREKRKVQDLINKGNAPIFYSIINSLLQIEHMC
ncbi:MAG: transposase [Aphanizomenon sp.]|jgi:transposase